MTTSRLGTYLLLEPLRRGALAELFLAKAEASQGTPAPQLVVLKRLTRELVDDPARAAHIPARVREVVGLAHPNLIQVLEVGRDGTQHWIACADAPGVSLRELLDACLARGEPLPVPLAARIMTQVCAGLSALHGHAPQRVHGAVSERNIRLGLDGVARLDDYGFAPRPGKPADAQQREQLWFLSPEQVLGEALDARSDVFSVGLVLFELLTGLRLYGASNEAATLQMVLDGEVPPLRSLNPSLPEPLELAVLKALARSPADRFQSAAELASALTAFHDDDSHSISDALDRELPGARTSETALRQRLLKGASPSMSSTPVPQSSKDSTTPPPADVPAAEVDALEASTDAAVGTGKKARKQGARKSKAKKSADAGAAELEAVAADAASDDDADAVESDGDMPPSDAEAALEARSTGAESAPLETGAHGSEAVPAASVASVASSNPSVAEADVSATDAALAAASEGAATTTASSASTADGTPPDHASAGSETASSATDPVAAASGLTTEPASANERADGTAAIASTENSSAASAVDAKVTAAAGSVATSDSAISTAASSTSKPSATSTTSSLSAATSVAGDASPSEPHASAPISPTEASATSAKAPTEQPLEGSASSPPPSASNSTDSTSKPITSGSPSTPQIASTSTIATVAAAASTSTAAAGTGPAASPRTEPTSEAGTSPGATPTIASITPSAVPAPAIASTTPSAVPAPAVVARTPSAVPAPAVVTRTPSVIPGPAASTTPAAAPEKVAAPTGLGAASPEISTPAAGPGAASRVPPEAASAFEVTSEISATSEVHLPPYRATDEDDEEEEEERTQIINTSLITASLPALAQEFGAPRTGLPSPVPPRAAEGAPRRTGIAVRPSTGGTNAGAAPRPSTGGTNPGAAPRPSTGGTQAGSTPRPGTGSGSQAGTGARAPRALPPRPDTNPALRTPLAGTPRRTQTSSVPVASASSVPPPTQTQPRSGAETDLFAPQPRRTSSQNAIPVQPGQTPARRNTRTGDTPMGARPTRTNTGTTPAVPRRATHGELPAVRPGTGTPVARTFSASHPAFDALQLAAELEKESAKRARGAQPEVEILASNPASDGPAPQAAGAVAVAAPQLNESPKPTDVEKRPNVVPVRSASKEAVSTPVPKGLYYLAGAMALFLMLGLGLILRTPSEAVVVIDVTPAEASMITVGGRQVTSGEQLSFPPGEYELVASAKGFKRHVQRITVFEGAPRATYPIVLEAEAPPEEVLPPPVITGAKFTLQFTSATPDVEVWVDGVSIGITPKAAVSLDVGRSYRYEARAKGFEPVEGLVGSFGKSELAVPLSLRKASNRSVPPGRGKLVLSTVPAGAEIHLDGIPTGRRTPVTTAQPIETSAGRHTLSFHLDDKVSEPQRVTLGDGQAIMLENVAVDRTP